MLIFSSEVEVDQAQLDPRHRRAVTRALRSLLDAYGDDYDPDACGFVVLVDLQTTDAEAIELMESKWAAVPWETVLVDKETNCFIAYWLANNQYGLTVLAPDEEWLSPAFRSSLVERVGGVNDR